VANLTIVTKSHIDEAHAASQHFPMAESADGMFRWDSISDGYVVINCALSGLAPNTPNGQWRSIYLQYGEHDKAVPAELLARAREFYLAVQALKSSRRKEAEAHETKAAIAEIKARGPIPEFPYPSSEAAWEAEDEQAWAEMRKFDL